MARTEDHSTFCHPPGSRGSMGRLQLVKFGWWIVFCWCLCSVASARSETDTLMQKVFAYPQNNGFSIGEVNTQVYMRFLIKTHRANQLIRVVPGMSRVESGERSYCGEDMTTYHVTIPGSVERRVDGFYSTMPRISQIHDRVLQNLSLSVYSPNLFSDRNLSPFNRRNRHFYLYKVIKSSPSEITLKVKPRFHNTQLVRGTIVVEPTSGRVISFSLSGYYDMISFQIDATMGSEGPTSLLPVVSDLTLNMKLAKSTISARFHAVFDYLKLLPESSHKHKKGQLLDVTKSYLLHNNIADTRSDIAYFDSLRPEPLPQEMIQILTATEDTVVAPPKRKIGKNKAMKELEEAILGTHYINLSDQGSIKIPPVITPSLFQFTPNRGFALQVRIPAYFNFKNGAQISFRPTAGYNFKQKQWYWNVPFSLIVLPRISGAINFEVGNGNHIYDSKQADEVRKHLEGVGKKDSLLHIFDSYKFHFYRDFFVNTSLSFQPIAGLEVFTGLRFHRRTLLNFNSLAQQEGLDKVIKTFAPHIRMEWTPFTYYYRSRQRRIPLYSHYPTFMVDYERGIPLRSCNSTYERWEFDTKYRVPLYALHYLSFRVGGGLYTNRKTTYFVDFDNFRDNNMPQGWDDELTGQFQLLDSRWYNESNYYLRACAAYQSPMLILSRIPGLTRIVQSEQIYCNLLSVASLQPYVEMGYGVRTHLIDVAGFFGISKGTGFSVGGKVSIQLFNNW